MRAHRFSYSHLQTFSSDDLYESFNMLDNFVSGRKKTFLRINFYRAYLYPWFFLRYEGITEVTMERNAANGASEEEKT